MLASVILGAVRHDAASGAAVRRVGLAAYHVLRPFQVCSSQRAPSMTTEYVFVRELTAVSFGRSPHIGRRPS